ncbi:RNA methyltransferase [Aquibacillus koreensis]|uniref:RNA methyltransferase n=1 Tax=Aquibacillus koreensis TaxID=279446 RepID=A0A9X4AGS2_9BACI|nr:RNA methyltransferase [Aquibacillus koreensis]MCT2535063.1 RNA methyltransferase [Aquibacillus koreensis]MDC3419216.1 RNA methyltransferase [Aquibacillus koreensis]
MITSVQNNKVKEWNKLKKRKEREKRNVFFIEGMHLVQEALHSKWNLQEVIIQDGIELPEWLQQHTVTYVSDHVFKTISDTKAPQGIAAVVEMKPAILDKSLHKLVLLDAVQDPGNLGTIIRTADAAGFDGVILGEGTVDLYNEKVIRATQGSLFHLPIIQSNLLKEINELQKNDVQVWAATLEGAESYQQLPVPEKVALVVGNEGAGIDATIVQQADKKVHIPIFGQAESLNVSVATGILLYYIAMK